MVKNADIRESATTHGVKLWQIAEALGITDGNFSRKLRKELSAEKKRQVMEIIDRLAQGQED